MAKSKSFWCTRHERVEPDDGPLCAAQFRLGPYPDRVTAERALENAQRHTEAWDAEDERWNNG